MLPRREILTLSTATITTGLAGCTSRESQTPPQVRIIAIELENQTTEEYEFEIVVTDPKGEAVFELRRQVGRGHATTIEKPVDGPGEYTLAVTSAGTTVREQASKYAETGDSCVLLIGRVDTDSRLRMEGQGYTSCSARSSTSTLS